tara:strand:- start:383 stop:622 length:240 start_codon:yes stop_codon:yes gene_type:complete
MSDLSAEEEQTVDEAHDIIWSSALKWCSDYDSMIVAANMLNGALRIYKTELSDREYRAFCETMLTLVDEVHPVHSGVKH